MVIVGVEAVGGVVVVPGAAPAPAEPTAGVVGVVAAVGPELDAGVSADVPADGAEAVAAGGCPFEPTTTPRSPVLLPGGSRSGPTQLAENTAAAISVRRSADHDPRRASPDSGAFLG